MSRKRIGVVLSGCGNRDGAEIHESVLTLYFLDRAGAEAVCMAPDVPQRMVLNYLTGKPSGESRNVLLESARIARGKIQELSQVKAEQLDGLILPGGSGAALNLSSYGVDGPKGQVNPALAALLTAMHRGKKPIGAICISPAVVAMVFAGQGIHLTLGPDPDDARALQSMGQQAAVTQVESIVVDETHNVISTAAYMCAASVAEVGVGIEKLVAEVLKRA
ncbi:MAG: isoprenoid biosynthesis glyoxalase ElbB [Magnetococcales bacterium]|nr:isoprenoid biosynthesis glyoxalase ElbB [Magnetococcales bacterium]